MRDFDKQIKINEITNQHFYYVLHILGITLSELSKFVGKSEGYYRKRKNLDLFNEKDVRILKAYIEEKYGKGVFEDKIYEAHLHLKNKTSKQALLNLIDNQNYEIELLKKENEELKEANYELLKKKRE